MPVTAVRDEGALRMWVCRLPVHIDPAERTIFYENLRRLRNFPLGRQSRRPLQRHSLFPVVADDSVRPQNIPLFTEIFGEFVTSQRADVGIGPYRTPANPYCLTTFERKADLQQPFKRNDLQIWCTVTGGAYHSARKVSMCVRND